ncbi:MAG: hypothetical protein IJ849_07155, partial [Selenomonadaceae bacterium]|nr:hypothetical protein [Selenomonadaceae bacterium]
LAFYCRLLKVSRQGFYDYRKRQGRPWKHEALANIMLDIVRQDPENDNYGGRRMYEALSLRKEEQHLAIDIPSERTVYRIMERLSSNWQWPD